MSEHLPAPDFDAQNYARPNDRWICGRACEGKACHRGPDKKGRCQATAECVPTLETKPGETKGRWRCNRPGGACDTGPLPDGTCCRPIPKCSPVPTLRNRRGRVTLVVVAATCAALLILLGGPWRGNFINPGPLSNPHTSEAFVKLHAATNRNDQTCSACHAAGASGPGGIVSAAFHASPGPLQIRKLASARPGDRTAIDEACQKCHTRHAFHQPNVTRELSCSICHAEHRGAGRMAAPTDVHCAFCHGDADELAAAAKGASSPASVGTARFPRPSAGFTQVIHSFPGDHPEFRVHADKQRDPNPLKFGHALHLTGETIPKLPGGKKLECAFCHQPDATGAYQRPVNFENHCRVCHSLQFDAETPDLHLPHGDVAFVSAFLRSLPKQYADFAARSGVQGAEAQRQFAERKLRGLQTQVSSGEDFEKRVFFSTATTGPMARVGTLSGPERALFPGCAYCHEVKSAAQASAEITKPVSFEHWFTHGRFDHAKHSSLDCTRCHQAEKSRETADIILPTKETCATCHSPRGGVVDTCVTCHAYHHEK